jgi:hypothetical protein
MTLKGGGVRLQQLLAEPMTPTEAELRQESIPVMEAKELAGRLLAAGARPMPWFRSFLNLADPKIITFAEPQGG